MSAPKLPVTITAVMRLTRDPDKSIVIDLSQLDWKAYGLAGTTGFDPALLDLMEIARAVHEFDRRQPKRTTGVRPKVISVEMPLRRPAVWTSAAKDELRQILRIQGNANWNFTFTQRAASPADQSFLQGDAAASKPAKSGKRLDPEQKRFASVVLFSGGLDSTSGLASLSGEGDTSLLVSYYTRNLDKQRFIADKLGFPNLIQVRGDWADGQRQGKTGGQFWYRSFLFLSIAAAMANRFGAGTLYQFENGPLALSVPPLDIYRITRHAHPLVHRHFETLLEALGVGHINVKNPALAQTKGQALAMLRSKLTPDDFKAVIAKTETCWYLNSRTVVAGGAAKRNGMPCGACIPCLVRKAALGADDVPAGVDFTGNGDAGDAAIRVHLDAYTAFTRRISAKDYTVWDFLEDVPEPTRKALLANIGIGAKDALDLYRRFAAEWHGTFP